MRWASSAASSSAPASTVATARIYFGRSIVRRADDPAALCGPVPTPDAAAFAALYPESLAADMERLRTLEKEQAQLKGLQIGTVHPPGGVIRHRGRTLKRAALPLAVRAGRA